MQGQDENPSDGLVSDVFLAIIFAVTAEDIPPEIPSINFKINAKGVRVNSDQMIISNSGTDNTFSE